MEKKNFSDIGKVEAIRQLFEVSPFKQKDGTAFLSGEKGGVVRTASRLWLEGIDFDLTYFPLKHLGYKCVVGTVGELYASLARPQSISVRLGISAKLDLPQVTELWNGICAAAEEHHVSRADLDLIPSRNGLTISIVVTGLTSHEVSENRKSANSKDLICISGNVGGAFLGMSLLEAEKRKFEKAGDLTGTPDIEKYKMLVGAYLKPEINPDIVSELAFFRLEQTHAQKCKFEKAGDLTGTPDIEKYKMLVGAYLKPEINPDIVSELSDSDIIPSYGYLADRGLADMAKRLNRDSGLGVKLYSNQIPFEGNSFEAGKKLNIDPVAAAMNGGDDFRIVYVVPISKYETFRHDFQTFSIIGHLAKPEVGTVVVTPEGAELPLHAQGWKENE